MEERLTEIERTMTMMQQQYDSNISDLNHHVTMLIGLVTVQQSSIAGIKASLQSVDRRLDLLENHAAHTDALLDRIEARLDGVENRLDGVESRLDSFDARLSGLDTRLDTIETAMNQGFAAILARLPAQES